MVKKSLSIMAVLAVGVLAMLVFCKKDNPVAPPPPPASMSGVWSGIVSVYKGTTVAPDTFTCDLQIDSAAGTYSLLRGRVCYGSSGSITDSARETGSWTKIGIDSLVLGPGEGSCYYWDPGLASWVQSDTTANSMFRTCPDPMHIKIDISGTTWNVTIPRFDDVTSIDYALNKQ